MSNLLLVEDDENLALTLRDNLVLEGHSVERCSTGSAALRKVSSINFDLIILDVMLSEVDGLEVLRQLRLTKNTPVLMISAKGRAQDRIQALELEADDYLPKPFHLKEFLLRVHALLRRAKAVSSQKGIIELGRARINLDLLQVHLENGEIESITPKESKILLLLLKNSHRVISREEILASAWRADESSSPRSIDNFIVKLRKWVEPNPSEPCYVVSHRGVGYSLKLKQGVSE